MKQRKLGSTEVFVHELGYGAMHLSINAETRPSEEESVKLLQGMIDDLGIDFIDTADAYCIDEEEKGHNERLIAKALTGDRRNRAFIATKGGSTRPEGRWERNGRPEHLRAACEASLKALKAERIGLYQLHAPDPNVPIEESVGTLVDLKEEGKIRFIGVSNFTLNKLKIAMKEAEITSLQNQYSVMNRRNEDEIIDFCEENGITYIPWNPVGGRGNAPKLAEMFSVIGDIADAHDTSPHVVSLAWLLQRSPAIVPIPGTRKLEHVADNIKATELELTSDELERLNELDAVES